MTRFGQVAGRQHLEQFDQPPLIGPCMHTIRNEDLIVPFEGFEDGLTGRQRGRALAGCTPGAASFLRAERPGVYMWILRPAPTAL